MDIFTTVELSLLPIVFIRQGEDGELSVEIQTPAELPQETSGADLQEAE